MQYQRPEVVLLGQARELILGRKAAGIEAVHNINPFHVLDSELDD